VFNHPVFEAHGRFEYIKELVATTWRSYPQNKTQEFDMADDDVKYYHVISNYTTVLGNAIKLAI
jgi:hypothetical protein